MAESDVAGRNPRVVHSRLAGGESVLLHLDTGQYHELNAIGSLIWEQVDGDRSVSHIAAGVEAQVDDPPDDLEAIIVDFLVQLRERGLIT